MSLYIMFNRLYNLYAIYCLSHNVVIYIKSAFQRSPHMIRPVQIGTSACCTQACVSSMLLNVYLGLMGFKHVG